MLAKESREEKSLEAAKTNSLSEKYPQISEEWDYEKMIHLRIRCLAVQIKECGGYAINAVMAGRLLRIQEHQVADALVARVVL